MSISAGEKAALLVDALGGIGNIEVLENCMTRLRVVPSDLSAVKISALEAVEGVLRVLSSGNALQIVMKPDEIQSVAGELKKNPGLRYTESTEAPDGPVMEKRAPKGLLARLSEIFTPLIPALVGSGLVAGFMKLLQSMGFDASSQFMTALNIVGFSLFSYLVVVVAMQTAKAFGGNSFLGAVAGCILLNPALANLRIGDMALVPGRGGVIGALLAGALFAFIEKRSRAISPKVLSVQFPPVVTVLVGGFLIIFGLQPLAGFLADLFVNAILRIFELGGAVAGFVIAGLYLPLVMTGLHHGLTPIHLQLIQQVGYSQLQTLNSMAGAGQVGAALAILLKYRSYIRIGDNIRGGLPVGILGIGEPLIYGVTLPLGRPFVTACLGAAVGGAFVGMVGLGARAVYVSGILGIVVANDPAKYVIAYLIACAAGFVLTYLIPTKERNLVDMEMSGR